MSQAIGTPPLTKLLNQTPSPKHIQQEKIYSRNDLTERVKFSEFLLGSKPYKGYIERAYYTSYTQAWR